MESCPFCAINAPAINKERLTDAINTVGSPLAPSRVEEAAGQVGVVGQPGGAEAPDLGLRGVPNARTPNRRSREDYNAYMREYMRRKRASRG